MTEIRLRRIVVFLSFKAPTFQNTRKLAYAASATPLAILRKGYDS
ncbi:unnamed protein product [Diplocarpon coronariae]